MKKQLSLSVAGLFAGSVLFLSAAQAAFYNSDEFGPANFFADKSSSNTSVMASASSMDRSSNDVAFGSRLYYSDEHGLANNFPAAPAPADQETIARADSGASERPDRSRLVVYNSDEFGPAQIFASDSAGAMNDRLSDPLEMTLAGTITIENAVIWHSEERRGVESVLLKNDQGDTFELADNRVGNDLRNLDGRTVEIKGTVLDSAGRTTISVEDYNILR